MLSRHYELGIHESRQSELGIHTLGIMLGRGRSNNLTGRILVLT